MKSTKMITRISALIGVVLFAGVASAASIVASPHDMSGGGPGPSGTSNEVCIYCHTPHGGQTSAPLWNKTFNAGYSMYSSPTLDMAISAQPGSVSLACLGCHDGTTSIGAMLNVGGAPATVVISGAGDCTFPGGVMTGPCAASVGAILTNDHPVGITYRTSGAQSDPAFVAIAAVKTAGLKFYGAGADMVECASCHNPHDNAVVPFLRISNNASAMCLTCHVK